MTADDDVSARARNARSTPRKGDARPQLNELARGRLGLHLRAMYQEVAAQPVPDRFRDLIARLDAGTET